MDVAETLALSDIKLVHLRTAQQMQEYNKLQILLKWHIPCKRVYQVTCLRNVLLLGEAPREKRINGVFAPMPLILLAQNQALLPLARNETMSGP